jgi:peptidyl-prolyl cis-trans isomerase D
MLHIFRESLGRVIAIVLLALIAVTFVFFGIDFSITRSSYAAKVNGGKIPIQEFEQELQDTQNQYQQSNRVELTDDLRRQLRRYVLDQMITREALVQQALREGYRVSDQRVIADIQSIPAFQVGGQFSNEVYRAQLAAVGYTPTSFEADQRRQSTILELQNGIVDSAFITPAEFRRYIEIYYERRQIEYALFAVDDFLDQVEVTDDDVSQYYADHGDEFMTDEAVDIEYVELELADIAATVEVSENDIRAYYESEVADFAGQEERHVSHIQVETEEEAQQVLDRLGAGEDFAALAEEVSDDAATRASGGDLGWISRGMMTGPFEDALYALPEVGAISAPVKTDFGWHILKLDDIRTSEMDPYEEVHDQIRDQLASDQAYSQFFDRANDLASAAFDAGDDLKSVAEEYDLPLKTIEGLTRNGGTDAFDNPGPIIAAAFDEDAIATGDNSDLIDIGDDHVVILRDSAHHLPEPKPLEEVSDDIRDMLTRQGATDLANDAATAFVDELDTEAVVAKTQDPAELAAAHGGTWNEAQWIERNATSVPMAIVRSTYTQSKPDEGAIEVLQTPVGSGDRAVILFLAAEAGVPDDIPTDERDQGQQALISQIGQIEVSTYAADVKDSAKVRIPDDVLEPNF